MSEIVFEKFAAHAGYEEMDCEFDPIFKQSEVNSEICADPYERQLVAYKSDETDNSVQESLNNNQPLFYIDFSEDRNSDYYGPSAEIKLFGQLHRLRDESNFDARSDSKLGRSAVTAYGRGQSGQTSLGEIVPILYCRKPLPMLYFEKTPVYVNSKQYERILKLRNKKIEKGTLKGPNYIFERPKSQTYRHESRSKHAKNRQRQGNGRFVKKGLENPIEEDLEEIVVDKNQLCPKIKRRHT